MKCTIPISFLILLFWAGFALGSDFPSRPNPPRLVNDLAKVISSSDEKQLENKLVAFDKGSSTQIAVVTMQSVGSYEIGQYAFDLAEKWGIGQQGKDNGILVLVAVDDRKTFIATGYGVEDVVPDALAKRIVENELLPNFRNGGYYKGLDEGTDVLIGLSEGRYTAEEVYGKEKKRKFPWSALLFFLFFFIWPVFFRRKQYSTYGRNGRHRGGWVGPVIGGGGFGGGGGGFSGGGGFGGFGGGSFGGGGAGGSW